MKKKVIEIIDDELDILEFLKARLEQSFPNVEVNANSVCCNLEKAPDILIIDFLMPNKKAHQCISSCIENGHFPKIIIWTAFCNDIKTYIEEVRKRNPNIKVLQKPYIDELEKEIIYALENPPLITICEKCLNPIYWIDVIDEDVKLCESCADKKD